MRLKYSRHSHLLLIAFNLMCMGCSSSDESETIPLHQRYQKGEFIYRKHNESLFQIPLPQKNPLKLYPWDKEHAGNYPRITKEFFRCKGSSLNPCNVIQKNEESLRFYDCGGAEKHSLPLKESKEFIYPILIELTNYIQSKTKKRIVITSGHRCPEHNAYVDPSPSNQYSKHMIGAEVAFYVQGLEEKPEVIINLIQKFYQQSQYVGQKEYQEFKRYEKNDGNVSTQPWFNKEIFIKLFNKKEGRNFDNRHPYPYISVQVRFDRDTNEKVTYTWEKAFKNYHRW